jgi:hypothetical protein
MANIFSFDRIALIFLGEQNPRAMGFIDVGQELLRSVAMNEPKDKDRKGDSAGDSGRHATPGEKRSGRVGFDDRGNSVWEWQLETGVYSRDVSTQRLKKLDLNELSIADTAINKKPTGLTPETKSSPGFNPYNSSPTVGGGSSPYDTARAMGEKFAAKPKEPPKRSLDDMRKLSEAIKKQKDEKK